MKGLPDRVLRVSVPERASRWLKRAGGIAGACLFATLLTFTGVLALHRLYVIGWVPAHWYHPVFAVLCVLPAAAAHGAASHAGARGSAWWLAWLPGLAVYAAFPWPDGGTWKPLWIFGHAWDWARAIFLHWDTAGPFAFNSFGAFVGMATISFVACGRLWLGAAKAFGRAGSDVLAPDGAEGALPSATWASRSETVKRFSAPGGIVLGELTDPTRESRNFAPGRPRSWGRQGRGRLITMSPEDGNGHVLVTSQASGFKTTGVVIPNILNYDGPLVVFDPKCELYARCRKAREDMKFNPVVIDARNGFDPARLIATLAADHPSAYHRMAKMVIPQGHSGIENAEYFKAAATNLFSALLAYFGETGSPNILQDVAQVLSRPPDGVYATVEKNLGKIKLPFVRNQLEGLKGMDTKFWGSVKTEITNQLVFSEMPDVQRFITMSPKSKLPSQVIDPRCDIFLNIPQNVAEDFAPMVRVMLGSMLTAAQLIEVNEAPRARRLFLIDEAAKLGAMDILENIRDRGRSLGLHLMMFYQTVGEIEKLWGRAGMTSWRDGCSATIMGPVSSRASAQDVSAMIGTRTLRVRTESTSSSSQVLSPMAGSVSTTEQEQLRDVPLISATAISQLPTHASIITATGRKPILASKAIWFTREDMKDRVRSTDDIAEELDVTKTRDALTDRLAKMTQDGGDEAAGPDEAGQEPEPETPASASCGEWVPDDVEMEGYFEPPWPATRGEREAEAIADMGEDLGGSNAEPAPSDKGEKPVAASDKGPEAGPGHEAAPASMDGRAAAAETGAIAESESERERTVSPESDNETDATAEEATAPRDRRPAPAQAEDDAVGTGEEADGSAQPAADDTDAAGTDSPAAAVSADEEPEGDDPDPVPALTAGDIGQVEPEGQDGRESNRAPGGSGPDQAPEHASPETGNGPNPVPEASGDDDAWTPEEAAQMMKLAQEELSVAEIAAEMGRSEAAVRAWSKSQKARGLLPLSGTDAAAPDDDGPEPGS